MIILFEKLFRCRIPLFILFLSATICLFSLPTGCLSDYPTWKQFHRSLESTNVNETNISLSLAEDGVQNPSLITATSTLSPIQSQPNVNINRTIGGPHLVVSGHLMTPHQIVVQPQPSSLFRAPFNGSIQMRGPSVYYGTPLVVNHSIPIPHTPSSWRVASHRQVLPVVLNQSLPFTQPPINNTVFLNSTDQMQSNNDSSLSTFANQSESVENEEKTSDRSLFSDLSSSLFGSGNSEVLSLEEEEESIELPSKKEKLLSKLAGKKLLAEPEKTKPKPEPNYPNDDSYEDEVVKPVKPKLKLGKKPTKLKGKVEKPEYVGESNPAVSNYTSNTAYPAPFPGHYPIYSKPKGKFIPQYRQSNITANENTTNSSTDSTNSTILETRATMIGVRTSPSYGDQVIPGYLAQEVPSSLYRERNITNLNNTLDDRNNKLKVFKSNVMKTSPLLDFKSHSEPYGSEIYELGIDNSPAKSRGGYPMPGITPTYTATYASPYGTTSYPTYAYPPAPPPPPPAAYPTIYYQSYYPTPSSVYPQAAPSSYPKILGKVLEQYPAKPYINNYSNKYDYSMPVAVVNLFCSDLKYPCSCTLYLTEINSYNMLISGVCSGLKKDKYYLLNLYEYGDITAGCEALGLFYSPASSYANSNLLSNLGVVKSDHNGVAFINKLKRDSLSVLCDKYGYKSSILGRAIGLTEAVLPVGFSLPLPTATSYRGIGHPSGQPLTLSKVMACGVIGLANKDNSYETRELKSKLIANAELEEQFAPQPIKSN